MSKRKFRNYESDFLDEIVNDFAIACKSKISKQALFDMASQVSWELTEWQGAIIGCPYWSELAFSKLKLENGKSDADGYTVYKRPSNKQLEEKYKGEVLHEHIVPRRLFTEYIIDCRDNKAELDKTDFKKMISCVIEKQEENKKLDENFKSEMPGKKSLKEIENPWERYIKSEIKNIYEVIWDKKYIKVKRHDIENVKL